MVWFMNNLYQKEVDKIFFNSREGYFLLKLYNLMRGGNSACENRYISAAATPAGSQLSVSIFTRTDSVQQSQH